MAGINYKYLSLMDIEVWVPRAEIDIFRLTQNRLVGFLLVQKSTEQKVVAEKERRFIEEFLFALDLQYNKVHLSSLIDGEEFKDAKFIIQLGEIPKTLPIDCQHALKINRESPKCFIQSPFKKRILWKELRELVVLVENMQKEFMHDQQIPGSVPR